MKNLLLSLLMILSSHTYSQIAISKDFNNTEWFTDETDFKISDTIVIKRMLHYETDYKTLSKGHIMAFNNKWRNTLVINFLKDKTANLSTINVVLCGISDLDDNWKWNFYESSQIFGLYLNDTLNTHFKIISKSYKRENWNYELDNGFIPTKFYTHMVVIQMVRIPKLSLQNAKTR